MTTRDAMRESRHATHAELADLAEGRLEAGARARLEAHLAACADCSAEWREVEHLLGAMRADRMVEPPADVVARAVHLFRPAPLAERLRAWLTGLAEEAGRLVFDSFDQPAFAAARGVMSGRRLRFEASGLELDVAAERREGRGRLTGQVVRTAGAAGEAQALVGARFLVVAGGRPVAEGVTDAIGEFAVEAGLDVDLAGGIRVVVVDGGRAVTFVLPSSLSGPHESDPRDPSDASPPA